MKKGWIKRLYSGVLIVSIMVISVSGFAVATNNKESNNSLLFSISSGNGNNKIAFTPDIVDTEKRGAESFAIAPNGDFLILDTIDNQVEMYNQYGSYISTVDLPDDKNSFLDIESNSNNSFFVLNYTGDILEYKNDKIVNEYNFNLEERDHILYGLSKNKNNKIVLRSFKEGMDYEIGNSSKKLNGYDGFTSKLNSKRLDLNSGEQNISIDYSYTCIGTYPIQFTKQGERLILENEALIGNGIYVETRVSKYKDGKNIANALALPTKDYYGKIPHKYIYSTDDGNAYQLILTKNSVEIYRLGFSKVKGTNIDAKIIQNINPKDEVFIEDKVSVSMVDASTAYTNAVSMVNYSWSYNPATMKTQVTGTTAPPDYLANLTSTTTVTGIPYCWGGAFGNVSACGFVSFLTKLSQGSKAGNVESASPSYVSGTAGVDCAGFISVAYRLDKRYGTRDICLPANQLFFPISWINIQRGDIGNISGYHVWMCDYTVRGSGGEILGMYTIEATTNKPNQKAKYYSRTIGDMQSYSPYTKW